MKRTPLIPVLTGLCLALSAIASQEADNGVRIVVDSPTHGSVIRSRIDMAPLAGMAQADAGPPSFDVMLVVDVSGSTSYPSGIDVDEDGQVGQTEASVVAGLPDTPNTDPDDSILAAEVLAGSQLLDGLDPQRVRVGVVSFSGDVDPSTKRRRRVDQADALLEQPLTNDYDQVARALKAVLLRGAHGGTNMEAGVKLGLRELAGLEGAVSVPRAGAKRVILFLTDGKPSLPFGRANVEDAGDIEAAVSAARLAKAAGITLNVFGLGPVAGNYPVAATEMARVTGGLYTPVVRPGDIVALLTGVSFANVEDVVAVNLTLGEMSGPDDILLHPDGSFSGFVPVRPGKNRLRISALASDGRRGSTELEIVFKHQGLSDAELDAELERVRKRNRELQLIWERKKQQAFRKKEYEKAVEIQVEEQKDQEETQP